MSLTIYKVSLFMKYSLYNQLLKLVSSLMKKAKRKYSRNWPPLTEVIFSLFNQAQKKRKEKKDAEISFRWLSLRRQYVKKRVKQKAEKVLDMLALNFKGKKNWFLLFQKCSSLADSSAPMYPIVILVFKKSDIEIL